MSQPLRVRRLVAANTPSVRAVLHAERALLYTAGVDARDGVPAHVRAASAIRRRGSRLIVVQDDVNALAVLDAAGGVVPLLLPTGSGGQRLFEDRKGNKHLKMDLEACVVLPDGRLVAFGSGSSPQREQLVIVGPGSSVQVVACGDALRRVAAMHGDDRCGSQHRRRRRAGRAASAVPARERRPSGRRLTVRAVRSSICRLRRRWRGCRVAGKLRRSPG